MQERRDKAEGHRAVAHLDALGGPFLVWRVGCREHANAIAAYYVWPVDYGLALAVVGDQIEPESVFDAWQDFGAFALDVAHFIAGSGGQAFRGDVL